MMQRRCQMSKMEKKPPCSSTKVGVRRFVYWRIVRINNKEDGQGERGSGRLF